MQFSFALLIAEANQGRFAIKQSKDRYNQKAIAWGQPGTQQHLLPGMLPVKYDINYDLIMMFLTMHNCIKTLVSGWSLSIQRIHKQTNTDAQKYALQFSLFPAHNYV